MPRKSALELGMERALQSSAPLIRLGPRTRSQSRNIPYVFEQLPMRKVARRGPSRPNSRRMNRYVATGTPNNTFRVMTRSCRARQLEVENRMVTDEPEPARTEIQAESNVLPGPGISKMNTLSADEKREYLLELERRAAMVFNINEIPTPKRKRRARRGWYTRRRNKNKEPKPLPKTTDEDIAIMEEASEFCGAAAEAEVPAFPEAAAEPTTARLPHPEETAHVFYPPRTEWLLPWADVLLRVRIYAPINLKTYLNSPIRAFKELFHHDLFMTGRHRVSDIRDKFICSANTVEGKDATNGFLFINRAFYIDNEAPPEHMRFFRTWCGGKNFSLFPRFDMRTRQLGQLAYRMHDPDMFLYIHDGKCEHMIMLTEARPLLPWDALTFPEYPRIASMSLSKRTSVCIKCESTNPKYILSGCPKLPHNIALLCRTCIKNSLYCTEPRELCKLQAYRYDSNEAFWY